MWNAVVVVDYFRSHTKMPFRGSKLIEFAEAIVARAICRADEFFGARDDNSLERVI